MDTYLTLASIDGRSIFPPLVKSPVENEFDTLLYILYIYEL